ncbi:MAG: EamA family transporter [Azonexus sp.]|jgi:drug/metabolite transporter (DMT)-like permease|uniref:EamA family transporter n=1 Tax=Azonexus sp. TaxID=1872668 RepID=UPI002825C641|nr:EamA family transporter [Azonexus sp.]MDR0776307.1 EamA family transporter [Azonexus sp.]
MSRAVAAGTAERGTMPILTIGFAWWLLGESISLAQTAGTALVVLGILSIGRR